MRHRVILRTAGIEFHVTIDHDQIARLTEVH